MRMTKTDLENHLKGKIRCLKGEDYSKVKGLSRLWRFLRSRRLALILLLLILFLGVVGTVFKPLSVIYSTWWFLSMLSLLVVSTVSCAYSRMVLLVKKAKPDLSKIDEKFVGRLKDNEMVILPFGIEDSADLVERNLRGYRFSLLKSSGARGVSVYAQKGTLGRWGSVIFHLSFALMLVGATYGGMTYFGGLMTIIEGQILKDRQNNYQVTWKGPFFGERYQGFEIRLDKVYPNYRFNGVSKGEASEVTIIEGGREVRKSAIYVNHSLTYKGRTFYQNKHGFSPLLLLRNKAGKPVFFAYVSLDTIFSDDDVSYQGSFTIPEANLDIKATLYPDFIVNIFGERSTATPFPKNPVIYLEVSKSGKEIYKGLIRLYQRIKLDDFIFSFEDIRYWALFQVEHNGGLPVIFASFWLLIAGLGINFFFTPKRIWAFLKEESGRTVVYLGGTSTRFKNLFREEFAGVVEELRRKSAYQQFSDLEEQTGSVSVEELTLQK